MSSAEKGIAVALQWICFGLSFVSFAFYAYKVYKKECGWEVIYICMVESVKYVLEILWEYDSPATLYVCDKEEHQLIAYEKAYNATLDGALAACGNSVVKAPWLRYAEWLLTCPVILIALSNLSGLKDDYNFRTMKLLSSDQGTIIMGVTAAYSTGGVKAVAFTVGVFYGMNTFYTAFLVYAEAFENVPAGKCKSLVIQMAWIFYASWFMFPALFLLGPEGAGHLSDYGSVIGHTFADLLSKNLWGIWSLVLRNEVRRHHRKLWFEEQARQKAGEQAFDVPKEVRPDFQYAVNNFFAQQLQGQERPKGPMTIEDQVDPFYAEYRRKRRLRRGSLSGNPDEDPDLDDMPMMPPNKNNGKSPGSDAGTNNWVPVMLGSGAGGAAAAANRPPAGAGPVPAGFAAALQQQGQQQPGQQQQQQQQPMAVPQQQLGNRSSVEAASSSPLYNPVRPMPNRQSIAGDQGDFATAGVGGLRVLVLDQPGDELGAFYSSQLVKEFGAAIQKVASEAELMGELQGAPPGAFSGVLASDAAISAQAVGALGTAYGMRVVLFGYKSAETCGVPCAAYLAAPQVGVPYTNDALAGVVAQHFGGSGGAAQQWKKAANAAMAGSGGGAGKQNIDKLLADIANLKATLKR